MFIQRWAGSARAALGFSLLIVGSNSAASLTFCQNALLKLSHSTELRRDLARTYASDPRLGLHLTAVSSTLDRLDNFTSPALVRTAILGWGYDRMVERRLAAIAAEATSLSQAVRLLADLPPHAALLLDLIESRYRLAIEILGLGLRTKGHSPVLSDADYARALIAVTTRTLAEIGANAKYARVFADFDFGVLARDEVLKRVEGAAARRPFFESPSSNRWHVRPGFADAISTEGPVPDLIEPVGKYLESKLARIRVGITYVTSDLASSVRFGQRVFHGNWFGYTSTMRTQLLRVSAGQSLIHEIVLNLSPRRKKLIALALDRSHQELDFIFGIEKSRGRGLHTCGSYAPSLFWKCGVPILSPVFGTPGVAVYALMLQKFLRLGNVESVRLKSAWRPNPWCATPSFWVFTTS